MKTYMFEGKEYVESGEFRSPKEGELYLFDGLATKAIHNYFCDCKRKILIPKEASMKYEQTDKKMSQESVLGEMTSAEKECSEARTEYSKFAKSVSNNGYSFWGGLGYDEGEGQNYFLNKYLHDNPHLYLWLVVHGFLEEVKEWKPVTLMIETEEEYAYIWHRLNLIPEKYEEVYTPTTNNPKYPKNDAEILNNRLWERIDNLRDTK